MTYIDGLLHGILSMVFIGAVFVAWLWWFIAKESAEQMERYRREQSERWGRP